LNKNKKMNIPEGLKYTKDHEWIKVDGEEALIGVTDFAQGELGDIVYVEIETEGEELQLGEVFGTVEAVKTVSDLFMPVTGKVIAINEELEGTPEIVNSDPYGKGWMIKVAISDMDSLKNALSSEAYKGLISQ
jgi:glycine cleavage system H protein